MASTSKKISIGRVFNHRWWLIGPLLVCLIALQVRFWFGDGGYIEEQSLRLGIAEYTEQNAKLKQRNAELKQRIEDLKNYDYAKEAIARRELGWVRADETFFMVVKSNNVP